ncbi:MAG: ClbS/DfsB family four-helix bundle protein [Chloroflexi bacterium]|nr:ClbS/DfsB family four-helix bundle protein [Chloroflexota bacterium]
MDTRAFLKQVDAARAEWDQVIAQISPEELLKPGVAGAWTGKDLIAHITWFELEMIELLTSRSLQGSSEWWLLPADERNALIYQANRDRSLDDLLAASAEAWTRLRALLETLDEQALTDPSQFEAMPPDWVPWQIIAQNSSEHYEAHLPDLRTRLAPKD